MIIGITGYAQHGKDTIAQLLVREYGYTRVGFADLLKELMLQVDPIVYHSGGGYNVRLSALVKMSGWEGAKEEPEVRRLLQEFGLNARAFLGEDVWVRALDRATESIENLVIPDVRFWNEADWVEKECGELWGVTRVTETGQPYDNGVGAEHPSEATVSEMLPTVERHFIANSVSELEQQVRHSLSKRPAEWT